MPRDPSSLFGAGSQHVVRAIQTTYKGYKFRSRLEARWAVFFEALGLTWEYEPEGFDLAGVRYLPDFRVRTPQGEPIWYEVKPLGPEPDDKFDRFVKMLNNETLGYAHAAMLVGDPIDVLDAFELCPRCGVFHDPSGPNGSLTMRGADRLGHRRPGKMEYWMLCYACDYETPSGGYHDPEPGFLGIPIHPHKGWIIAGQAELTALIDDKIRPAAEKARAARFEHGETP